MYKVGDLVKITSFYEDTSPPNLGIVVAARISGPAMDYSIWYSVWIWGNFVEFLDEELELADEFGKKKNNGRRLGESDK